jgi:hypothetical protein
MTTESVTPPPSDSAIVYLAYANCSEPVQTLYKNVKNCRVISDMIADCGCSNDLPIPLPLMSRQTCQLIVEWLEHQLIEPISFDEQKKVDVEVFTPWAAAFYGKLSVLELVAFQNAAHYLDHRTMHLETARYFASLLHGKTIEQMRARLGCMGEPPLTNAQLEAIANENDWSKKQSANADGKDEANDDVDFSPVTGSGTQKNDKDNEDDDGDGECRTNDVGGDVSAGFFPSSLVAK